MPIPASGSWCHNKRSAETCSWDRATTPRRDALIMPSLSCVWFTMHQMVFMLDLVWAENNGLRFRVHKVALAAEIEKAFLMVSMSEKDRDVLRFLWVDDIRRDDPTVIPLRFTRVVFGVLSILFLLNARINHHLKKHSADMPDTVAKNTKYLFMLITLRMVPTLKTWHTSGTRSQSLCLSLESSISVTNSTFVQMRID